LSAYRVAYTSSSKHLPFHLPQLRSNPAGRCTILPGVWRTQQPCWNHNKNCSKHCMAQKPGLLQAGFFFLRRFSDLRCFIIPGPGADVGQVTTALQRYPAIGCYSRDELHEPAIDQDGEQYSPHSFNERCFSNAAICSYSHAHPFNTRSYSHSAASKYAAPIVEPGDSCLPA
jgi:hypothetical protein